MQKISSSAQDYLEAILELAEEFGFVKSIDVSKKLNVSRASVNRAINLLKEQGYLTQERYSDVYLTEKGKTEAQTVKASHMILKSFLTDILEVSEANSETDACMMEHCLSSETRNKLKAFVDKSR